MQYPDEDPAMSASPSKGQAADKPDTDGDEPAPEMSGYEEKLASLFVQYTTISNHLWSVYAATTVILLGLSIAGMVVLETNIVPARHIEASLRAAVMVGFGFFSVGNMILLWDAHSVLVTLRREIEALENQKPASRFYKSLRVISKGGHSRVYVPIYHLSTDFCVQAALWAPFILSGW